MKTQTKKKDLKENINNKGTCMTESKLLPKDYHLSFTSKNYLHLSKLQEGSVRIRFMKKLIGGWVVWKDNKPHRFPLAEKLQATEIAEEGTDIKAFWCGYVWDYDQKDLFVLDITQTTIISEIRDLAQDPEWGDDLDYDIVIKKTGSGLKTKYSVNPRPKKPITNEMIEALEEKPVHLPALYEGKDPWEEANLKRHEYKKKLIKQLEEDVSNMSKTEDESEYISADQLEIDFEQYDISSFQPVKDIKDKFTFMPEYTHAGLSYKLYPVDTIFVRSSREAIIVTDLNTGESIEFVGERGENAYKLIKQFPSEMVSIEKKTVRTIIKYTFVSNVLLKEEERPDGLDDFPVVPIMAYFDPNTIRHSAKFKSIVSDMRDPQYFYNRVKLSNLAELEAQQQGLKVKEGSLVEPDAAARKGYGQILVVKNSNSLDDVQTMSKVPPHPVNLEFAETLKKDTLESGGATEELMGLSVDDKSGILTMLKQNAGLTRNQKLLDNLDAAQARCGEIKMKLVQENWTPEKVQNVVGEQPTPEFFNKLFAKYNIKSVLGVETDTQQQLEAQQLVEARDRLGIPISSKRILQKLQIQSKDEIIQEVEQQEAQQMQQEQAKAQVEMSHLQADIETKKSFSAAEVGKAQERIAKAQQSQVETEVAKVEAHDEHIKSLLEIAEALKVLQGVDLNSIEKKIGMIKDLTAQQDQAAMQAAQLQSMEADQLAPQELDQQQAAAIQPQELQQEQII